MKTKFARTIGLAAALSLLPAAAALASQPAPRVSIATLAQLPKPIPKPYDEGANATAQVAAAKARALKSGKRLLIDLGGNWCPDCRLLAGVMQLPEMHAFLTRNYEMVTVDVGRFDKNLSIPQHYGIAKPEGVPAVLIVDPKTDRLVNAGRVTALSDARSMTPQALADWLAQWTR